MSNTTHMFRAVFSPAETVRFLWRGSWDWPVPRGSQSCPSSLRRSGVQRRGSMGSFLLPGLHQQMLDGPRREGEVGAGAQCWAAPTLAETSHWEFKLFWEVLDKSCLLLIMAYGNDRRVIQTRTSKSQRSIWYWMFTGKEKKLLD